MGIECISCSIATVGLSIVIIGLAAGYTAFWVQAIKEWLKGERIGVLCMSIFTLFGLIMISVAICSPKGDAKAQQTIEVPDREK